MDRTKHIAFARKNAKVIRISRETEGKTFLAKTAYSLNTSVNNSHHNKVEEGDGSCAITPKLALSTCIQTCHNLENNHLPKKILRKVHT